MNKLLKTLLTVSALAICLLFMSMIGGGRARARMMDTCSGLKVSFRESYQFIGDEEVRQILERKYGAFIGQRMDSLRLDRIEAALNSQSAILNSEAFATDDGCLNIIITQRKPVLRLQMGETGFYADDSGYIFPLQPGYPFMVPVIDGNIDLNIEAGHCGPAPEESGQKWMTDLIAMLKYMEKSGIWAENIAQINVGEDRDLMLFPREGKERFIFGYPSEVEEKFRRIETYYKCIKPAKEDDWYRSVNVKFDNQIICKK